MPTYRLVWTIDIDADTPLEAAEKALSIQRDPDSIATVFEVEWHNGRHPEALTVDLSEPEEPRRDGFWADARQP